MNIDVIIIKNKLDKYALKGIDEYAKRLSRYCKIKKVCLKNESLLAKTLKKDTLIYKVEASTETMTSEAMADMIDKLSHQHSHMTFLIGTSHDYPVLSVSSMSFSLDTTAMVLFEQIYRCYRIMNNHPYHK